MGFQQGEDYRVGRRGWLLFPIQMARRTILAVHHITRGHHRLGTRNLAALSAVMGSHQLCLASIR